MLKNSFFRNHDITLSVHKQRQRSHKGPFKNFVDKKMRGRGSKMSVFVHAQGIKAVHTGGKGGSKNGKILST